MIRTEMCVNVRNLLVVEYGHENYANTSKNCSENGEPEGEPVPQTEQNQHMAGISRQLKGRNGMPWLGRRCLDHEGYSGDA